MNEPITKPTKPKIMDVKDIQDLVKLINKSNLSEFKLKDGEFELTIRTKSYAKAKNRGEDSAPQIVMPPQVMPVQTPSYTPPPAAAPAEAPAPKAQAPAPQTESAEEDNSNYLEIKSPIVGTFYRSPSPDKPAYLKVGDTVAAGQVVCIVEAMKLFNEIESEISGKIVKVLVEDASPVEYDQVLFLVDPKG